MYMQHSQNMYFCHRVENGADIIVFKLFNSKFVGIGPSSNSFPEWSRRLLQKVSLCVMFWLKLCGEPCTCKK